MTIAERVVVADSITPVVGWRAWRVTPNGLASVNHPWLWVPGEMSTAQCIRTYVPLPFTTSSDERPPHPAPSEGCTCGFYTAKERWRLRCYPSDVIGRVAMWGKVIEYDGGWRAEKAYPQAFFTAYQKGTDGHAVLGRYGVPILSMNDLPGEAHPKCSKCDVELPGEVMYLGTGQVVCSSCCQLEYVRSMAYNFTLSGSSKMSSGYAISQLLVPSIAPGTVAPPTIEPPKRRPSRATFVTDTLIAGLNVHNTVFFAGKVALGITPLDAWSVLGVAATTVAACVVFLLGLRSLRP